VTIVDRLFASAEKWADGPQYWSQYRSTRIGGGYLVCAFRYRPSENVAWRYNISYISFHVWDRWDDLGELEAHCILHELLKRRTWYIKLRDYLRSN
jgi:hypothetical protein